MRKIYIKHVVMVVLFLNASSGHAQESLFNTYLPILNKAFESQDTEDLTKFRSGLTSSQREYLDLRHTFHRANENQGADPCKEVRSEATRHIKYKSLLFTAENDFSFFCECELWNALRYNKSRSKDDKIKAVEILKKVANEGYAEAQYNLAMEFGWFPAFKEMGLEEDLNQHLRYMKMAAEQDYSDAIYRVALAFDHSKDFKSSIGWLEKAIVNETEPSTLANYRWHLAEYYEKGVGVEKDLDKAFDLYKAAADIAAGVHFYDKTFSFGLMLYEGKGPLIKNRELGLKYIRKAARSETLPRAEKYCDRNGISY